MPACLFGSMYKNVIIVVLSLSFTISCGIPKEQDSDFYSEIPWLEVEYVSSFTHNHDVVIGNPGNLGVDNSGERVFVVDRSQNQILVFDPDLKLIDRIERTGNGPGEFIRKSNIRIHDNTLYVFDFGNFSVSLLDMLNDSFPLLSTHRFEIKERQAPYTVFPFGEFHLISKGMGATGEEKEFLVYLDLYSKDFALIKENYIVIKDAPRITFKRGDNVYLISVPFGAEPVMAVDRELSSFIYGTGDTLKLWSTDGEQTEVLFEIELPVREVTSQELNHELSYYNHESANLVKGNMPEYKPSFTGLFIGDNYYWINQGYGDDQNRWLVIDRDGEIKRQFKLDKNIELQAVYGNRLYGIKEGDEIEPAVFVFSFEPF